MIELLNAITPEEIYRYGSWLFVFWVAQLRQMPQWLYRGNRVVIMEDLIIFLAVYFGVFLLGILLHI